MGKIKGFFSGIGKKLKGFPKGRQGKAFVRILQFFAIMIVLTIFARGVASVTMPEVELTTLSNQSIRKEEKFNGTITASSKTDVKPPVGLKVSQVHVSIGDNVKTGDNLVTFDTVALDEDLLNQRNTLLGLQQQLKDLQDNEGPDDSAVKMAEKARDEAQKAVNEATSERNLAQSAVNDANAAVTAAENYLNTLNTNQANDLANWQTIVNNKVDTAKAAATAAATGYWGQNGTETTPIAGSPLAIYQSLTKPGSNPPEPGTNVDPAVWAAAQETMEAAKANYEAALAVQTDAYNFGGHVDSNGAFVPVEATAKANIQAQYGAQISAAQGAITDAKNTAALASAELATKGEALDDANTVLADAQKALQDAIKDYNDAKNDAALAEQIRQNNIRLKKLEIEEQQKVVDAVAALQSADGVLKATSDGMVSNLTLVAGAVTTDADYVQLSTSSGGLMVEFKVTQAQLRDIQIGSSVSVVRDQYYWPTEARITGRGIPDESGMVTMRAQLSSNDFNDGDQVNVSVLISDRTHWNCVPVGAVRPDTDGSYVLVLYEESTILGTQTVARKVPVTVVDQNSDYAAIEGLYENSPRIVLTSSKPVNDGDMVRIGEDSTR